MGVAAGITGVHTVTFKGHEYMYIGTNITTIIANMIVENVPSSCYAVVADASVTSIYLPELLQCLREASSAKNPTQSNVLHFVIPQGEESKTREMKCTLEDWALSEGCNRDTCFIAFGGGVVGDLVGFTASTYMRGVPLVQIPTTLLAMVDSSIGGKNGVNTKHGKNMIGTFYQPRAIYADLKYLKSLPKSEMISAFGEIIKMAAISCEQELQFLERLSLDVLNIDLDDDPVCENNNLLLERIVYNSAMRKLRIVECDEKESNGVRELLNFGHTFGHALEKQLGYLLPHGVCVALGCVYEAEISRNLGHLSDVAVGRLIRCFRRFGLPAYMTDQTVPSEVYKIWKEKLINSPTLLTESMKLDKKFSVSSYRMILLSAIGKPLKKRAVSVTLDDIRFALSPSVRISPVIISGHHHVSLWVPGSKSISNRALIISSMGVGECLLKNILRSDDVMYMIDGLEKLSSDVDFIWQDESLKVVKGSSLKLSTPCEIYVGNSGTASRFLTAFAAMCTSMDVIITGNERMQSRPIGDLVDALTSAGVEILYLGNTGSLPIRIHPTASAGYSGLTSTTLNISASESSQFVSALLMCAPYLKQDTKIKIISDKIVSKCYIYTTLDIMAKFNAVIDVSNDYREFNIKGSNYINPAIYHIEGDASSAAYPLSLAAACGISVTVDNMGSSSTQGDAKFAPKVLSMMGAIVTQTETKTTVKPPANGLLKPLGTINMDEWTDSFLVTAAIAALAPPTDGVVSTRITGIENQRVKECNRIKSMVTELSKFGVKCVEHEDGIEIFGTHKSKLHAPAFPGCNSYDDHRIAISLSVLSSSLEKGECSIISDRHCVEKTWPNWWCVLSSLLNMKIEGVTCDVQEPDKFPTNVPIIRDEDMKSPKVSTEPVFPSMEWHLKYAYGLPPARDFSGIKSVILIGFRASGKTYLGRETSLITNLTFIDMDTYFSKKTGCEISHYILGNGWGKFRELEVLFLNEVLAQNKHNAIISCGGGVICTKTGRAVLNKWIHGNKAVVIHVWRDFKKDIIPALSADSSRPHFPCSPLEEWNTRKVFYECCSNYEFFNLNMKSLSSTNTCYPLQTPAMRLARLIHFASTSVVDRKVSSDNYLLSARLPPTRYRSHFVCIKIKNIESILQDIDEITTGVAAIELRVDALDSYDERFVSRQLALLRSSSFLPIIFTVRSSEHSGLFPNNPVTLRDRVLNIALRQGCEIVDVECSLDFKHLPNIQNLRGSRSLILSSYHDTKNLLHETPGSKSSPISATAYRKLYSKQAGLSDIVKLVLNCDNITDIIVLETIKSEKLFSEQLVTPKPLISFTMGNIGPLSRVLNTFLSPVSHRKLPEKAAPGQLQVESMNNLCHILGLKTVKYFYLFGNPISKSPSPLLFNTAFRVLGQPYEYKLCEMSDYNELKKFIDSGIEDGTFGGGSVTIPLKVECVDAKLCQKLSVKAVEIGSLNTLYTEEVNGCTILAGENTDFIGIESILRRYMLINSTNRGSGIVGVVIGGGGTSRAAVCALKSTGCSRIYIWNRTFSKAQILADLFKVNCVSNLRHISDAMDCNTMYLMVSTIPSHAQNEYSEMFNNFIKSAGRGCLIEMAYGEVTELIEAAKSNVERWDYADGLTVLVEQASYQFRIFSQHLPFPHAARQCLADQCQVSRKEMLIPL